MKAHQQSTKTVPEPAAAGRQAPALPGRWIVVSLSEHHIRVLEEGRLVRDIANFSTGRDGHATPLLHDALIDPDRRYRCHASGKYKDASGKPAAMPYSLFFHGGCAFHAGDTRVPSHGCIHLSPADAEWLFGGSAVTGFTCVSPVRNRRRRKEHDDDLRSQQRRCAGHPVHV